MLPLVGRALDRFLSRGEGLDERGDPFAPPLGPAEQGRLLDAVRAARLTPPSPPLAPFLSFASPLPPPGGSPVVEARIVGGGARWALVAPHYGSLAHATRLGVTGSLVRALRRAGYAVALLALPYHASRAPPGRPSGWGYVRADLAATARAVGSSAAEAMALARWLREERGARELVGVGVSLGGAGMGLAAAVGAPFDALALLAAVDNPAAFYATGEAREARRRTLLARGFGPRETTAAFAPIAPSSFPAPLPGERIVFGIAPEDGVVPGAAQEAWRSAWGGRGILLRGHGHATALSSPRVARRIVAALPRA